MSTLQHVVSRTQVSAARFTAIGALNDVTLGWFDWQAKTSREIPLHEQVEALAGSSRMRRSRRA